MANCSRCGAETELYDSGVPICVACADREAQPKPPETSPEAWLRAESQARPNAAREEYRSALIASQHASELRISLASDNPDGSLALRNANRQLALAGERFRKALVESLEFGSPQPAEPCEQREVLLERY